MSEKTIKKVGFIITEEEPKEPKEPKQLKMQKTQKSFHDIASYIKESMILHTIHYNERYELWDKFKHIGKKPFDKHFPHHLNELLGKYLIKGIKKEEKKLNISKRKVIKTFSFSFIHALSFSSDEKWDEIYFLDLNSVESYSEGNAICYKLPFSNESEKWSNLIMNNGQKYKELEQANITFDDIKEQLGEDLVVIFNGTIDYLLR
ncbi:MAG: hypothetical protein Terrestrivirus4_170 [Terrestrivirus sp.]|uniref:Uncharacterized protein n=1 Tax=Terrestrivirus sp. TaxID=2487775 RepID=A0A3G4ZMN8_9VIRU|nr:MAG: hypothetical protein Terrestrivirus4_170 [Terrestrivirus sp.]